MKTPLADTRLMLSLSICSCVGIERNQKIAGMTLDVSKKGWGKGKR